MHKVVKYSLHDVPELVGTYQYYWVAVLVAVWTEVATGCPTDIQDA